MATTDMYYRFLWDTEPADEQLQALMQEVGEDVRHIRERVSRCMKEKLRQDFIKLRQNQFVVEDGKT
jgi:hypothetical protein